MSTSLARRRVALRAIVLVQLALVALVAWSVRELVSFDGQVPPGMVFLVAGMLACTMVAFRATFRRSEGLRGHRFAFMSAEALCAFLPVVGEKAFGLLRQLPAGVASSGMVELMMGLELLAAGCVAAAAAILAPWLLAPPPESRADSPYDKWLAVWAAIAIAATVAAGGAYKARYAETHTPEFLIGQLFTTPSPVQQRLIARRIVDARSLDDAEIRDELFRLLTDGPVVQKTWSAYLLIVTKNDDGRAMTTLRQMIGTFATLRAVEMLAQLGEAAAPAVAELGDVMTKKTSDEHIAELQSRAADALAQIGAPAIGAVPALVGKLGEKGYWELQLSAAAAIDRIDPGYAARCVVGAPSVLDALPTEESVVELKPECRGN